MGTPLRNKQTRENTDLLQAIEDATDRARYRGGGFDGIDMAQELLDSRWMQDLVLKIRKQALIDAVDLIEDLKSRQA